MDGGLKKLGVGCLGILLFFWFVVPAIRFVSAYLRGVKEDYDTRVAQRVAERDAAAERQRLEEQRLMAETARKAEEDAREASRLKREERLRNFSMKEAPVLWTVYQDLQGAIVEQDKRIANLAKTLEAFNKNPREDADYMRICSMRDEMVSARDSMRTKIEDAYLAFCKFQATPSRKDYDDLRKKTLEDGIKAAEITARRFDEMRSIK